MSIRKSVPRPVRAVHTIRQTVARQPVIGVIPPLSSHFCNRCFPLKVDLQPFVTIVCTCAPGPRLAWTGDLIESRELRDVIRVMIRRCRYCVVGKMATLHTKRKEATAIYLIISISILKTFQHIKCRILWFCEIVELIRTAKAKTNTCFLLLKRFTLKAILSAKLCKYLNSNINLEEAYTTLDLYLQYIKAIVCIIRVS